MHYRTVTISGPYGLNVGAGCSSLLLTTAFQMLLGKSYCLKILYTWIVLGLGLEHRPLISGLPTVPYRNVPLICFPVVSDNYLLILNWKEYCKSFFPIHFN